MYQPETPKGQSTNVTGKIPQLTARNRVQCFRSCYDTIQSAPGSRIEFLDFQVAAFMARLLKLETVLVVLLAVVGLAFFPVARGPYSATHGPVTTPHSRYDSLVTVLRATTAGFRRATAAKSAAFITVTFGLPAVLTTRTTSPLVLRI